MNYLSKQFVGGLAALMLGTNLSAQTPDWENPSVFAVNKEAPRATSLPYNNEQLAVNDVYEQSPYYLSLNGTWKFRWVKIPAERPVDFTWRTIIQVIGMILKSPVTGSCRGMAFLFIRM